MRNCQKYAAAVCILMTLLPFQLQAASKKGKTSSQPGAFSVSSERVRYPDAFSSVIENAWNAKNEKDFDVSLQYFVNSSYSESIFLQYKNQFLQKKGAAPYASQCEKALGEFNSIIPLYASLQSELSQKSEEFNSAVRRKNFQQASQAFDQLYTVMQKAADIRNQAAAKAQELKNINTRAAGSLNLSNEANYTLLAWKWAAGYDGADGSGVIGVMNAQYDQIVSSCYTSFIELTQDDSKKIAQTITRRKIQDYSGDNSADKAALASVSEKGSYALKAENLYSLITDSFQSKSCSEYKKASSSASFIVSVADQCSVLLEKAGLFCNLQSAADKLPQPADSVTALRSSSDTYASTLVQTANTISEINKTASAAKNAGWFTAYNTFDQQYKYWEEEKTAYLQICNMLINDCTTSATKLWIKTANWFVSAGNGIVESNRAKYESLKEQVNTPSAVLSAVDALVKQINDDKETLTRCDSYLDEGYAFRSNFTNQRKDFNASASSLDSIAADCAALKILAQENHTSALVAKKQVDYYYNKAQTNFSAGDFTQAHANLDRANSSYSDVLEELKKDTDVQQECYASLISLRQEFIEKEKPILVNEIRKYKNNAKNYYYAGEFDQANALLAKAESRRAEWAKLMDTTLENDDELQRLKEMVNTALSIKEGRIIYPEDPLYPEMSQLLSIAKQYFDTAEADYRNGNRTEAEELLNLSKEKLNELKLVYPRNQEASILSLKIDRLLDPEAFDQMFAEKVRSLKKIKYSTKDALALESYNDLLDLYQINPSYTGLKDTINSIEIDLGIRQKPVSNTSNQQAQNLALQAQSILNGAGRDETLLSQAREKANSALKLNPDNDLAIQVLDEISLRSGGEAAVVLSAADEEIYQSAVKDLQDGNVFTAKQKIDQLLSKSANKRSAKLLKLKKRIEASL